MGASSGGVEAILRLAGTLAPGFPAPVLFVQHIGAHRSDLPRLVSARGPNPAVHPEDGEVPRRGKIYIAPPDHHMALDGGRLRIYRGPKEHHARPAIDPLFRSAAIECGSQAVGVILTGLLDDGSAGLRAVKDCGGTAIVQDPADAVAPSMPRSAIAAVEADHVVPLASLGKLLNTVAAQPAPGPGTPASRELILEHALATGEQAMHNIMEIGQPSAFTCPDCGGVLFELDDKRRLRFRCHTGHSFSLRSLASVQEELADSAIWISLRALQEKEAVLRRMASLAGGADAARAASALREADELDEVCKRLRALAQSAPGGYESFDIPP